MNSNLSNSNQERNYYFLSHNGQTILVGSDHAPDFEIDMGDFEHYLLDIDRIGTHIYPEWGEEYTISMEEWLEESDQNEIDDHLTFWIINGGLKEQPDLSEIPLPVSDPYEFVKGGQRPIFEEERYLKHVI